MIQTMEIQVLSPAIGALVKTIDLADASQFDQLKEPLLEALHQHHVLFFENQPYHPAGSVI